MKKQFGGRNDKTPAFAPAFSTFLAKLVAVPATLPFEQYATRAQGGLTRGKAFRTDVMFFTLGREISFSVAFWTINEHLYRLFRKYTGVVNATTAAALFSGAVGGIASYPMDALRTWKTNYPERFNNQSVLQVVKAVSTEKGIKFLFSGMFVIT